MKQNKVSLSSKQYAVPFILITSLFFMWGFARAILDVLNKHFQNELDITITQSSLLNIQLENAKEWRNTCLKYFQTFSKMKIYE